MHRFAVCLLLLLLCGPSPAASATSLSLGQERFEMEGEGWSKDEIFDRIDALEERIAEETGAARAELSLRLAKLYLSTDLIKHRRHALDLLDRCLEEDPSRFEAASLWAAMAQRMRYTGDAESRLEQMVEEFDDDPRSLAHLGRFHFREGRLRMLEPRFRKAVEAFRRAVAVDSLHAPAWQGLAASHLALAEYDEAATAAVAWGRLVEGDARAHWMLAAARAGEQRYAEADSLFADLLESSSPRVRAIFVDAQSFLNDHSLEGIARRAVPRPLSAAIMRADSEDWTVVDDVDWSRVIEDSLAREMVLDTYWRERDERPTQLYNSNRLLYWRRLVEADVLFGDPDRGRRGWDTELGEVLVRWGRPTSTFYAASGDGVSLQGELEMAGVRLVRGDGIPQGSRIWIWTYRQPGAWFSLLFTDPTRNSRWLTSSVSAEAVVGLSKLQPLSFYDGPSPPERFELDVTRSVFPRTPDEVRLETYLRVRRSDPESGDVEDLAATAESDTIAVVEWALFDEAGERVDYRREIIDDRFDRSRLLEALGRPRSDFDPALIWSLGARVHPGLYRLAVEVSDARGNSRSTRVLEVDIPDPGPFGLLEMSDLQLAIAAAPYSPELAIPPRFVKFGQVVLPSPSRRLPLEAEELFVYLELRQPAVDDSGATSLDISYEVFESRQELRSLLMGQTFRREDLDRIDPLSVQFREEQTGVSNQGVVVKGTRIEIADLGRGDYVLVVTARDRIAGQSVSRALGFRKSRH